MKALLAQELTERVHSEEDYLAVQQVSNLLFNKKAGQDDLRSLSVSALGTVAEEIPSFTVKQTVLNGGVSLIDLMSEYTQIVSSKSEARRAIKGNAVSVNKQKIGDQEAKVGTNDLLHGRYLMVENGKKNKFMLVVE